ncbi:MAG: DEAD/DEAH box helicase family protein [Verrucomicrobiales bacterium]|nr:DEAD/DEAH box helicase family protein [Verrucomicrobiales bacterium]
MDLSEKETRARQIDIQLARAGWTVGNRSLVEEFLLRGSGIFQESPGSYRAQNEFVDYVLPDRLGRPLAIVEAKRASRSPLEGEQQAADYADRILATHGVAPFIFLANGDEIWFWHRPLHPPRKVSGFFNLDDLERLAFLDRYHETLNGAPVSTEIVDRAYQTEAVKAVAERIEHARRKFLLVMATGTGKTRTAIAFVELLLRQKWIQRVLFLADRRELVKQALDAFKQHLPSVPRARIETGEVDPAARVLAATYPGMMAVYPKLSHGCFDLVIADESHRSIYNRYRAILDHFDAIQLGLTATPTDFIEHNTFQLFACEDGLPTFHYGYEEAIRDGHLASYRPVHVARTHFQVEGLQPGQLPPELLRDLQEQGLDAADLTFEGTDLERRVTNTGTNDAIVREFMDASIKDAVGTLPAKSIVFAVSHRHALELYQSFNRLYPDLQRRGLARIIDSHMERVEKTLDDFKHKDFPRVAISVDMLDTGIDVPAIRNLVFAKPVFSQVKFWQMIGRGTRLWTDPVSGQPKGDFLIIDHWDNFAYFQINPEGSGTGGNTEPLPTRLFRLRLEKLQILLGRGETTQAESARQQLQSMLHALPIENVNVAPHAEEIRRLTTEANLWIPPEPERIRHLSTIIAPLLRFATTEGWAVLQFENLTEQLALAHLKADTEEIERLRERITENLRLLPEELPEIRAVHTQLAFALSPGFWEHLDCPRIAELQSTFAPLMRFRARRSGGEMIRLTLPDSIAQRHWIVFGPAGEGAFVETYRERLEAFIRDLAEEHPALRRLRAGQELSPEELESISRLLNSPDLFVTEERLRQAYDQPEAALADFLRHILGLARLPSREQRISQGFEDWIARHPTLNATQLMFLRTLRQAILNRAEIASLEQLHEAPFSRIGDPERLFAPAELDEILGLAHSLAA